MDVGQISVEKGLCTYNIVSLDFISANAFFLIDPWSMYTTLESHCPNTGDAELAQEK